MQLEKDVFLNMWEREFQTTLRVLDAFPHDRHEYRPHEKSSSAKQLAWTFVAEEKIMILGALIGKIDFTQHQTAPETMKEIIEEYRKSHAEAVEKVKAFPETGLGDTMKIDVGPKTQADVRKMDIMWMAVMDMIHHRGQMTVYNRLTGGKVPSIYGPSADETWN